MGDKIDPEKLILFLQVNCRGSKNGIRGVDLVAALNPLMGKYGDRHLREVVSALRDEGYPICSKPETGYYWAESSEEIKEICAWFHARAVSSLKVISRLKRKALPILEGQLFIPGVGAEPQIPEVPLKDYSRVPRVSVVAHIPEELHQLAREWVEQSDWDADRLYMAAIALFLLHEGVQAASEIYTASIRDD